MSDLLFPDAFAPWFKPIWVLILGGVFLAAVFVLVQLVLYRISPKLADAIWGTAKKIFAQPWFAVVLAVSVATLVVYCFCMLWGGDLLFLDLVAPWFRPLWVFILGGTVLAVELGLVQLVLYLMSPKLAGTSWGTAKETMSQSWLGVVLGILITTLVVLCVLWGVDALAAWLKPVWLVLDGAIAVVVGVGLLQFVLGMAFPSLSAVAWAAAKECLSQPLFYVLMAVGAAALLIFPIFPYFTFGDDVKVVKDTGLVLIMVLSVILALWTASASIAEEIEGRTAMTVLSKPIARWHFILGKFLGIIIPVVILFVVLGTVFLFTISYKVKYDARETCNPAPTAEQCQAEMVAIVPGLALAFMEAVVLASISVAISTRLPMLPNLVICGAVYVLGNLVPTLVNSTVGQIEFVRFAADLLSAVLPMLENFNIYPAIAAGKAVSWSYVGLAGVYCVVYSTAAMLVALLLFEDRDLA
ncbi:MAG TPA: hypothetical protein VJL29_08290 [Thermoguttaceae bacterium]|nr:hypothetical protein [Thermoguttaceae bacterium]